MVSALSRDLRTRVIKAVEEDGMSRRQAAIGFGVSVATAVRWLVEWRQGGRDCAKPMGGDRHSHRIERHADFLLAEVDRQDDITLAELQQKLWDKRGVRVAISTIRAGPEKLDSGLRCV
ncbi:MAG TPA: helix-turn-helix domain-containing protein, partial [Alphaproteobacteria bacterium]|nr:helix-turn-helix domain-containing protein [Alphaproteobacteria bacterium]